MIDLHRDIQRAVDDLSTCPYTSEAFTELLGKIQSAIDRLNLEGYANLDHWVVQLDKQIEGILLQRLTRIIGVWCSEFDRTSDDDRREQPLRDIAIKRRAGKGHHRDEKVSLLLKGVEVTSLIWISSPLMAWCSNQLSMKSGYRTRSSFWTRQ